MPSDDVRDNPILFCVCEKESKFIDPITRHVRRFFENASSQKITIQLD